MAKRGTLSGDKAIQGGFGIQSGIVRVKDARFKIQEWSKKDGSWTGHVLVWQLDVQKSDPKGVVEDESLVEQQDFILCWGSKEKDENGNPTYRFHPANSKGVDDEEPEDLGVEVGTEGNTFCTPESAETESMPFKDAPAVLFSMGLEKLGFRKEVSNRAYCPEYVGLVIEVETVQPDVLAKHLGVRYNPPKDGKPQPQWMVKKIHVFPWDAQKSAGKAKGAAAGAGAGKGASASTSTASASTKSNGKANGAADEVDIAAYAADRAREVGKDAKGKELTKGEFKQAVYKKALKEGKLAGKYHKALQDFCASDAGILELAGEEILEPVLDEEGIVKAVAFS